ncbi:hypothetical protein [Paracoccus laeviglucosivorans]|uniref:Uncharacterized protein n=1 Tax=Paracoccus laeviglucosivorans TaxID=1197861 RepID=A0A521CWU7_9RHOB|nr:hypothetical protein [Paracoccus laeviglucosivorans]SMO63925.1 hypothetical protein SAMN06265221_105226 [Paracoccus laeviglucosivorans]
MTKQDLIEAIEQFSRRSGIAPATVTGRAVANSRLYQRMKAGGSCTMDVAARVMAFIAANSPPATSANNTEHPHENAS